MSAAETFEDLVWYVSYGSNMNYERFMKYINACDDRTEPRDTKAVMLPFNMYFSGISKRWHCPVCFLDTTCEGQSYGVAYLITREQLDHIVNDEGYKYAKCDITGKVPELKNHSVFTLKASSDKFSYDNRKSYDSVSQDYLNVITNGLKAIFKLTDNQAEAYLRKCGE